MTRPPGPGLSSALCLPSLPPGKLPMLRVKERAFAPLCNLTIEDLVPADHFYRHLEAKLDLSFIRDLVADRYATIGRPAIDPVVFFKLQLVMFFEGIRSEREVLRMAADRLSVRWYLGYDLDEALDRKSTRLNSSHANISY